MGLLNASGKKRRRDDIYLPDLVKDNAVLEGFQFIDCTVRGRRCSSCRVSSTS